MHGLKYRTRESAQGESRSTARDSVIPGGRAQLLPSGGYRRGGDPYALFGRDAGLSHGGGGRRPLPTHTHVL